MSKEYSKMISDFDQTSASLGLFAGLLAVYHSNLCEKGFLRPEALVLVKELQSILFAQAFNMPPEKTDEDE